MVSTVILVIFGILGLLRIGRVHNTFTKVVTFALCLSALALCVNFYGISTYAQFAVAFFSLLASFESTNSFSLEKFQVAFIVVSGMVFFAYELIVAIKLPLDIPVWPLLIVFLFGVYYLQAKHYRQIRTRLGILLVWSGLAISSIINRVISMF